LLQVRRGFDEEGFGGGCAEVKCSRGIADQLQAEGPGRIALPLMEQA
jgi:hypothetical protein